MRPKTRLVVVFLSVFSVGLLSTLAQSFNPGPLAQANLSKDTRLIPTNPPLGTKKNLPSDAQRAKVSDGKTSVASMNRAQLAYFLEKGRFATTLKDLAIRTLSDSEYNYQLFLTPDRDSTTVIHVGSPQRDDLPTFVGLVHLAKLDNGEATTINILCASATAPAPPLAWETIYTNTKKGELIACPTGFTEVKLPNVETTTLTEVEIMTLPPETPSDGVYSPRWFDDKKEPYAKNPEPKEWSARNNETPKKTLLKPLSSIPVSSPSSPISVSLTPEESVAQATIRNMTSQPLQGFDIPPYVTKHYRYQIIAVPSGIPIITQIAVALPEQNNLRTFIRYVRLIPESEASTIEALCISEKPSTPMPIWSGIYDKNSKKGEPIACPQGFIPAEWRANP